MSKIAHKSRSVKGKKRSKASRTEPRTTQKKASPPRYTIRKDSLDRRYAIEKRTGKRVPLSKATQEQARRKKAAAAATKIFHGIIPKRASKAKTEQKRRSQAAKKGWETRRAKETRAVKKQPIRALPPKRGPPKKEQPPLSIEERLKKLIPKGMKMHMVGGMADRAERYPKVKEAADYAWVQLQAEMASKRIASLEGRELPKVPTPRFDRLYGDGHGSLVRSIIYDNAEDYNDVDTIITDLYEHDGNPWDSLRELYTLHFSPEAL